MKKRNPYELDKETIWQKDFFVHHRYYFSKILENVITDLNGEINEENQNKLAYFASQKLDNSWLIEQQFNNKINKFYLAAKLIFYDNLSFDPESYGKSFNNLYERGVALYTKIDKSKNWILEEFTRRNDTNVEYAIDRIISNHFGINIFQNFPRFQRQQLEYLPEARKVLLNQLLRKKNPNAKNPNAKNSKTKKSLRTRSPK